MQDGMFSNEPTIVAALDKQLEDLLEEKLRLQLLQRDQEVFDDDANPCPPGQGDPSYGEYMRLELEIQNIYAQIVTIRSRIRELRRG